MQPTIQIPITPVSKPRMTKRDTWRTDENHPDPNKRKRPAVVKYHNFVNELKSLVKGELDPRFDIVFLIPMPKSWPKKKKAEMYGKPHQDKPDIDNYLKAFMDAMCSNDSYVFDAHPRKYWAYEGRIDLTERGFNPDERYE